MSDKTMINKLNIILDNVDEVYNAGVIAGASGGGEIDIPIDLNYDSTSTNAQSGIAVAEAVSGKMDKFGEVTETDSEIKIKLNALKENGLGKKLIIQSAEGHCEFCINEDVTGSSYFRVGDSIIESVAGSKSWDFGNTALERIGEPNGDTDAATKGYVDKMCVPEREVWLFEGCVDLANNKEYIASNPVSSVEFCYSNDVDIICSLIFTTAAEGDINITFPEDLQFIGGAPQFGNGETWEIHIKNGIATGSAVYNFVKEKIGDIETAAANIIALQEAYIGGNA